MEIGIDRPSAIERLAEIVGTIRSAESFYDALPRDCTKLSPPGSDIERLLQAIPEPVVDPRLSILAATDAAIGSLRQIREFLMKPLPTSPIVLLSLARTALLSAARVTYCLGPESESERIRNLMVVMRQEAAGLDRLYQSAEQFVKLRGLIPPASIVATQRERLQAYRQIAHLGEAATLQEMSAVVGRILSESSDTDWTTAHSEHVAWMFNTYSGAAHGFAWPKLVPGTKSMSGDFIAELGLVAPIALLSCRLLLQRSQGT